MPMTTATAIAISFIAGVLVGAVIVLCGTMSRFIAEQRARAAEIRANGDRIRADMRRGGRTTARRTPL